MKKYLATLDWLWSYDKQNLSGDLTAGLTVGVMLIPQGMAYAMLAGLPPIYGLYASTIPLIVYALMGSSRQLAVGPVAMVALLIASGVGQLAAVGSSEFIVFAILLALMVGLIQFSMGVFRLGFVVNFLSHPVIAGFTSAAAVIIAVSQFKHVFGLDIARAQVHETIINIFQNMSSINIPTLSIALISIITLLVLRKLSKKIPAPLIIVLMGMLFVYLFNLDAIGVKILKEVPAGMAAFQLPLIDLSAMKTLLPIALTISFVGFMESIAVAKAVQVKHKDYKINPNQELMALGMANILGSLFKAFPVTGGFSRTAVNDQAGAKTGLASIISALLIIITLLFLTPYFYYLPNAVLAAIIIVAVYGLIDFKEAKHLWKTDKQDFALFIVTALATLFIGIEEGILIGVVLSVAALVYRSSYPHIAELGEINGTGVYRNLSRFKEAKRFKNTAIVRIDAQLFFANVNYFKDYLDAITVDKKRLIIHAGAMNRLDSSAAHALIEIVKEYKMLGIRVIFTNVIGPVRDIMKRNGLYDAVGCDNFYPTVREAVRVLEENLIKRSTAIEFQSNV